MIGRLVAAAYVATVAGLTAYAFRAPDLGFGKAEAAAGLLTMPTIIPAFLPIELVGAAAWGITDAADGGPMWPVTLTFTVVTTLVAWANVILLRHTCQAIPALVRRCNPRQARESPDIR